MQTSGLFLVACALIYLPVFLLIGFFDRYLLAPVPLLLAGFTALSQDRAPSFANAFSWRPLAFVLTIAIGLFFVASTRDYLGWNRLRWQALSHLTEDMRVDPQHIDGGTRIAGAEIRP